MRVTAKVTLNQSNIKALEAKARKAHEMTTEAVLTDIRTSAVVPKAIGELEREAFVDTSQLDQGKTAIIFVGPYARRLYWHPEYNFRQDMNPNAQGRWMDMYLPGGDKQDFAQNAFRTFMRGMM